MEHFICEGTCGGESPVAKTCDDPECTKHGEPLTQCTCEDGKHGKTDEEKDQ